MNDLVDGAEKIKSLISLLKNHTGLSLSASVHHVVPGDPSPHPGSDATKRPELTVEFSGPDLPLLLARDAELLHAIEHLAGVLLGLAPSELDRIAFDADGYRARRTREIGQLAAAAVARVRATRTAYVFPAMNSRERRLLHLALAPSGLTSASTGERFNRSVVLYPEGATPPPEPGPLADDRRSHTRRSTPLAHEHPGRSRRLHPSSHR